MHNDSFNLSQQVTSGLNQTNSLAFLTDATVAAADNKQGLKDAIKAVKVHNDQENIKYLLINALDFDPNITDANILSLTTVAGLIALTGITTQATAILV